MSLYSASIIFIILLKVVFIGLAATHLYYKIKGKAGSEEDKNIIFWKERIEFIFIAAMSCLLIYIFNPRASRLNLLTFETKILFYVFGFILIITAKWGVFFNESKFFKEVQKLLK